MKNNKKLICKIGLHKYKKINGEWGVKFRYCILCGKQQLKEHTLWENSDDALNDVLQHTICPCCLSNNIDYTPQFSGPDIVSGTAHCKDCGYARSVV